MVTERVLIIITLYEAPRPALISQPLATTVSRGERSEIGGRRPADLRAGAKSVDISALLAVIGNGTRMRPPAQVLSRVGDAEEAHARSATERCAAGTDPHEACVTFRSPSWPPTFTGLGTHSSAVPVPSWP